jgi:hypothetical protein
MTENEKENLIRQYAAGGIAWSTMREHGIDNVEVWSATASLACVLPSR